MTDDQAPDRGRDAAAHLQRAALEFIEAARALLDIAEEAVREPGAVANVVTETVNGLIAAAGGRAGGAEGEPSPVEHIRIS